MKPSLNNKSTNAALILISGDGISGAIVGLMDNETKRLPPVHEDSILPSSLASLILSYMREHAIGGIDTYIPVLPGLMSADNATALSRMLKMRHHDIQVMSVADLLAYGAWNRQGVVIDDAQERKAWAMKSRMIMVFLDGTHAKISMIDSGRIIGRLSLADGLYEPFDPGDMSASARIMHSVALNRVDSWVRQVFSPARIVYYMSGCEPDTPFSLNHETFRADDMMADLVESVRSLDMAKSGDPEFIANKRGDFDDLVISIPDENGNERSYPIFQHE